MDPYNMNVDDLFGDSEPVALPPLAAPTVKGLAQRLDELGTSGCCQRISWSKSGCVAYIAPDGHAINLRAFSRDPVTGKWDLGKEALLEIPHGHYDHPFVHVSWSHLGHDLAVVDAAGHVLLFSPQSALDRMVSARVEVAHPEPEWDAVVGMHWLALLPYEQKNHIMWSATGKGDTWAFRSVPHVFKDAHHPVEQKAAMIYLKRFMELRLRFQQADGSWHEVGSELGPPLSTRDAFSHAAFASNGDNTLLLTAYDISGRLHLYRIEAKWNIPPPKPGQPPLRIYEKPELLVAEISTEDACYPITSTLISGESDGNPASNVRIPAQLTHLSFLPKTPEENDGTLPTIQAIFSTPPTIVSFDQTQAQAPPCSIVARWEVRLTQQNPLHSCWDQVTSKKKSVSTVPAQEVFLLQRLPDIVLHAVVLAFYPLWYNMILGYCYSDGTIEFRKRSTMDPLEPDYNTETVTCLSQAGFVFPTVEPSLYVALSPNHCMAACMQQDGTIKLRSMEYTHGSLSSDEDDLKHSSAVASLVLQCCSAVYQYFSSDDVFAIIGELPEKRRDAFIQLMFQGLNVNIDCGVEGSTTNLPVLLGRSPFVVKTLSAAHLLGLQGTIQRSVPSKIAWMILNMKYITAHLTTIVRLSTPGGAPLDKSILAPQYIPQSVGVFRWILHFIVYVLDDIFELGNALRETPDFDRATLESKIKSTNRPTILLLLSSFPRIMMRIWVQHLQWVSQTDFSHLKSASAELRRAYNPLKEVFSEIPIEPRYRGSLVTEAHNMVSQQYKRANLTDVERNHVERDLLFGRCPDVLFPVAKHLLTSFLFDSSQPGGCLADKISIAKILFFETEWLGLTASQHASKWHKEHVVDVSQKIIIRGEGAVTNPSGVFPVPQRSRSDSTGAGDETRSSKDRLLKRCTRCGAYMEDIVPGIPGYTPQHINWLTGMAKYCICSNAWALSEGLEGMNN